MARELTEKQGLFLHYIATEECKGDFRKAMKLAGYSDTTPIKDVVGSLRDELIEVGQNLLAANSIKAVMGMADLIDSPNTLGAANKLNAAKEIMDRAGLNKKEEKTTTLKIDGVIILPAKGSVPSLTHSQIIDVTPNEPSLVEQLENVESGS